MSINWFPGHMAKAMHDIQATSKVDLILEVVDARAIQLSKNSELTKKMNIDKLTIALKADCADLINRSIDSNTIVGSIKNKDLRSSIIKCLDQKFNNKIQTLKSKGLIHPQFYIMVVGLPNVGKSSLINYLAHKSILVVQNRPGITKNKQLVKINDRYFLYDTPGIFLKNVSSHIDGIKLALLGVIKKEILPSAEIVEWAFNYFNKYYPTLLTKRYDIRFTNFGNFIDMIALKYHFLKTDTKIDIYRSINFLLDDFINCKGMKINYEK